MIYEDIKMCEEAHKKAMQIALPYLLFIMAAVFGTLVSILLLISCR